MVTWNPDLLCRIIAPDIDQFTAAEIPDLRDKYKQHSYWLTNHFLNNTLRAPYKGWVRQYAINIIFRAEALFRYYHEARALTQEYLDGNDPLNPKIAQYYRAAASWENAILHWSGCFTTIWKASDEPLFQPDDGSVEERIYRHWTLIKHHSSRIVEEELPDSATIPIWLTNDGLESLERSVTYAEFAGSVANMADLAEELVDPLTFAAECRKLADTD